MDGDGEEGKKTRRVLKTHRVYIDYQEYVKPKTKYNENNKKNHHNSYFRFCHQRPSTACRCPAATTSGTWYNRQCARRWCTNWQRFVYFAGIGGGLRREENL
ncbi:MAG: hypothetical protein B6I19_01560 [Bacteroidetes bacterium 4572_114]|nr:MAG: hypothetical protein B6I19_01560 [Bacteroidetes bacterium 4572_114]